MQIVHALKHSRTVNVCQAGIENIAIAPFCATRSWVNVSDRLNARIRASGLSKAEIARRAGISPSRLANYLTGGRTPDPQMLDRLAAVLGTDGDELNGATEGLSVKLSGILARLFQLNGLSEERGQLMAEVAIEALRALRSLPDEGDAVARAHLAAQLAWQAHTSTTPRR
jgi:transcriptional regulator with XRE-family HTH domain